VVTERTTSVKCYVKLFHNV